MKIDSKFIKLKKMRVLTFWIVLAVLTMLSRESVEGKLKRENVYFNFTILLK